MPLSFNYKPDIHLFMISGSDTINVNDIETFNKHFNEHIQSKPKFKMMFDLRNVSIAHPDAVSKTIRYIVKYNKIAHKHIIASAIIVNGFTIESLATMVISTNPPPTPTKVTSNVQTACDFLNEY